jgi:splicing factor 3B subunit 1
VETKWTSTGLPPRAELDEAERILAEAAAAAVTASSGRRKRRWDVADGAGETTDVKMEEAEPTTDAAPKKRRSRWDAAPTDATEAPKRSRWDQTPHQLPNDAPMVPIIMNAPGFMQDDKHNRYLTDEELDALLRLPAT